MSAQPGSTGGLPLSKDCGSGCLLEVLPVSGRLVGQEETARCAWEPVDAAGQVFQENKGAGKENKEPSPVS